MDRITHYGRVSYKDGKYTKLSGSDNWTPDLSREAGLPLGQVQIRFSRPVSGHYGILVSAEHNPNAPLMSANYGGAEESGFTVHLWENIADRTVINSGFSFAVLATD